MCDEEHQQRYFLPQIFIYSFDINSLLVKNLMIPKDWTYYLPQIGLIDFILISFIEIAFIWFFVPKEEFIGKVLTMVAAVNFIKVGVTSFVFPIIPSLTDVLYIMYLVEVTVLFIVGIIVSTLVYEKENWSHSREQAGALAFRISFISTLVWLTYKNLQPQVYYQLPYQLLSAEAAFAQSVPIPLLSVSNFGFLTLVLGLVILYFWYKGKNLLRSDSSVRLNSAND